MKVLVTGGCGFLGSHVCEFYAKKGAQVVAYDNMTKHEFERTDFDTEKVRDFNWDFLKNSGITLVKADVRNYEELVDHTNGCDYIIHTAAQPAMTISWEDPRLDITTNVMGTFNVLEAARKLKIPVACCATIHVYGNKINEELKECSTRYLREPENIDENYPTLGGSLSPLHASKAASDIYAKTYMDTYQLEVASFRLTGIYGTRQFGGEDHGWVANFAIKSILNQPITIFGTGKQVRDIIDATDVCAAFDAFYKTRKSGIYNIGGGIKSSISLLECINLIEAIIKDRPIVKFAPERYADLRYFICDISRAKNQLGWQPKILPREGVAKLIDWLKKNRNVLIEKER